MPKGAVVIFEREKRYLAEKATAGGSGGCDCGCLKDRLFGKLNCQIIGSPDGGLQIGNVVGIA